MSASELLSSRLMFPTPLASDKSTCRDAANLDVFLSDNGIFRKRNKDGTIWSLSLSAAVFYLTPAASEGYRSTLKPAAFRGKSPSSNLSAQVIHQEQPLSEKAALNPRALRLKTLGNAVCPPQAYPIFHYISLIETGACAGICPYGGGDG